MLFRRVVIGCDHAAPAARAKLVELLKTMGAEVVDVGVHTADRVDYPDKAVEVCTELLKQPEQACGVILCGTGIGVNISANKVAGVRAALCHDAYTAEMARRHNDANVLCMGARVCGPEILAQMLKVFVSTEFEGGRHAGRVEKIMVPRPVLEFAPANDKTLVVSCDHAAYEEKAALVEHIKAKGYDVVDVGACNSDRVDYPDMADSCIREMARTGGRGILLCGSGIGISIAANKFEGIRAALCHEAFTAQMARNHNNANILVMGARTTGPELHKVMVDTFLAAEFEGGRHAQRVEKMMSIGKL